MLSFLKRHPFAVEAFFDYSLVLTYAVPKQDLQIRIPACLTLDTFQDKWAFVAVAMVQTKTLRPKGFPTFLGNDFFLVGYRIFVRYTTQTGKRLRGLYILRSETDSKKMAILGSFFTLYQYSVIDIQQTITEASIAISSQKSQLDIAIDTNSHNISLPPFSPFNDWKEARRFAGPLPFTFSYVPKTRQVLIVEGIRETWQPTPVQVLRANLTYFDSSGIENARLASAFIVRNILYEWKPGRTEQWNE